MQWQRHLVSGFVAAVLLAACSGGASQDPSSVEDTASTPNVALEQQAPAQQDGSQGPPSSAAPVGDDHPLAFEARKLGGGTLSGVTLAGKPVALWMWAPW